MFYFLNLDVVFLCLFDFWVKFVFLNIFFLCMNMMSDFVVNFLNCVGIMMIEDWVDKVGSFSDFDLFCNLDLIGLMWCSFCFDVGLSMSFLLILFNLNLMKCFYYIILYVVGVVNEYGLEDISMVVCMFGLLLKSLVINNGLNGIFKSSMFKIVFGFLGVFIGVLVVWGVIIMYWKSENEWK